MFKTLAAFLLLAVGLRLHAQDTNSVQSWASSDGKIIQAKFVRLDADAVVIERDGKPFTIPFTKLAPTSVDLAKRLQENAAGEGVTTTQVEKKSDAATITEKLNQIIIPKINFSNTPVREAIEFLHQRSVEQDTLETDPKRKGVEIVFSKTTAPEKIDALRAGNMHIKNIPLGMALKYVCDQTKLRYIIEGSQVTLIPQAEYETEIHSRTLTVPPDFWVKLAAHSGGGAEKGPGKPIIQLLGACGIVFPEGTSATLSGNQLVVSNTRKELDKIERIVVVLAAGAASGPTLQFRWLQTDPKTADAIVDLIKANNLSADAFSAKIAPQIKSGKITEVAAFDRKIISGERFLLRPANGNLPLVIEAEATVGNGYMDLRCVAECTPKTPMGSGLLRCNTATMLSRQHWYLFARWGDGKTDTLLLACGGSNPTKPAVPQVKSSIGGTPVMIHLDAEWRETSAADLAKVLEAPPESRTKALAWLRGRSTLLASATGTCRSGQKSAHEHLWGGRSDADTNEQMERRADQDPKESLPRPGVVFEWEPTIMPADKQPSTAIQKTEAEENQQICSQELSLHLQASYMPLKSRSKSQGMEFVFRGNKLQAGVPEFVAATAAPPEGQPVVVVVLTPWYDIIR